MGIYKQMIDELYVQQRKKGLREYGETMEECGMNAEQAVESAMEECIDALMYLCKAIDRIKQKGEG